MLGCDDESSLLLPSETSEREVSAFMAAEGLVGPLELTTIEGSAERGEPKDLSGSFTTECKLEHVRLTVRVALQLLDALLVPLMEEAPTADDGPEQAVDAIEIHEISDKVSLDATLEEVLKPV